MHSGGRRLHRDGGKIAAKSGWATAINGERDIGNIQGAHAEWLSRLISFQHYLDVACLCHAVQSTPVDRK